MSAGSVVRPIMGVRGVTPRGVKRSDYKPLEEHGGLQIVRCDDEAGSSLPVSRRRETFEKVEDALLKRGLSRGLEGEDQLCALDCYESGRLSLRIYSSSCPAIRCQPASWKMRPRVLRWPV